MIEMTVVAGSELDTWIADCYRRGDDILWILPRESTPMYDPMKSRYGPDYMVTTYLILWSKPE